MVGVEQINGILLVDLNAVVCLLDTGGNAHKLDALEQLLGIIAHREMVAVEVRLAFGAVDNELIDLADTAADLERSREHCTAHADNAGIADASENSLGILELFLCQGRQISAWGILVIVLDHNGHDHVSQRMRSRLYCHDFARHGSMDRCGNRRRIRSYYLPHRYIVTHSHGGLAGRAYVLCHGDDDLRRRCNDGHRNFRCLHVIGMHAAFKSVGHNSFTS